MPQKPTTSNSDNLPKHKGAENPEDHNVAENPQNSEGPENRRSQKDPENPQNSKDPENRRNQKDPKKAYGFSKNNQPGGHYLVYEIWEDKHPDQVAAGQKLDSFHPDILSAESLKRLIPFWQGIASSRQLKHPIITHQGDIGSGPLIRYGYTDGRGEVPPNAKCYARKPVFDKNISIIRNTDNPGKSLIYHSPLHSATLYSEIENFNQLLIRFFNGEFSQIFEEYSDQDPRWQWHGELVVDNEKLRGR